MLEGAGGAATAFQRCHCILSQWEGSLVSQSDAMAPHHEGVTQQRHEGVTQQHERVTQQPFNPGLAAPDLEGIHGQAA